MSIEKESEIQANIQSATAENYINIDQFNNIFGSLKNFYYALAQKNFYLPEFRRGLINVEYLFKVANQKVFCPKNDQIKPGGAKSYYCYKKPEIFKEINQTLKQKKMQETGLNQQSLPSKQYLLDILWVLDQQNWIFSKRSKDDNKAKINFDFPFKFFDGVNVRVFPVKRVSNLVRLTEQQREETQQQRIKKMLLKKQDKLLELEQQKQKVKLKETQLQQQLYK